MAKFTKLNIGDSVASSGGRVWKKLSAESGETTPKTYNLSVVTSGVVSISNSTAPTTITEGETVTFTLQTQTFGEYVSVSYTSTATVTYETTAGSAFRTIYTFTVSNPTGDVVITITASEDKPSAPDLPV